MTKQTILKPFQVLVGWPKRYTIPGFIIVIIILLGVVALWPRTLTFSYSEKTCINHLVVAPGIFKSTSKDGLRIVAEDQLRINGVAVAAKKACVLPVAAPRSGNHIVMLAPFGWQFVAKTFHIAISKPPVASTRQLEKQVPVTRPLTFPLTVSDKIFSYKLAVEGRNVPCVSEDRSIACDLEKLSLKQGARYVVLLERYFKNKKVATLSKKTIETLKATTVIDTSVKQGETVYSKPKELQIKVDKPLVAAEVQLMRIDGDKRVPFASEAKVNGAGVTVTWSGELGRSTGYELVLVDVEAQDGSSLVEPYTLPFKMSGGPKVTGVNIGRFKVPIGTTAVVTFDQPLLDSQDIHKAISATGGAAVTGFRGNQVFVSTAGAPKCGDFSIRVSDALLSNYEIAGGSSWQHNTRVVCYTVGSIGTSVKGRAITAYYIGSGPTHIIYVGAIHGTELSTRSLMMRWLDELEANARNIPADKTIVIIPTINPDGAARGNRTNANNVDLNRNFDVSDWKKDVTTVTNAPFPGGGGPAPMSEPETKALASLVLRLRPRMVLSYHSVGGVVAGNQAGDSVALAGIYASLSGYSNVSGATASTFEYQVTGTADDYYAEKLGIPSILIELGSSTYHEFVQNQRAMWAMLRK